ncbi:lytic transglycosylase domain-containing protein [Acetobacter fabarum]|uniref:lytic transglycosylase domain-containing protein n=1 Tax=Acetobacter fabarum TaxID=483199 RepID=UPI00312B3D25
MTRSYPSWRRQLVAAVSLVGFSLTACSGPSAQQVSASGASTGAADVVAPARSPMQTGSLNDRLDIWLRLVGPTHASAQDYADFLQSGSVWPRWSVLTLRMQQALAGETDTQVLARLCHTQKLTYAPALVQCAAQLPDDKPLQQQLAAEAVTAWTNGNDTPAAATALAGAFGASLTPQSSWLRFDRQERTGLLTAAQQTLPYLSASGQSLAQARLALRNNDATARSQFDALPASARTDSWLVLDLARWLRKQQRYDEAVALWKAGAIEAERTTRSKLFWRERDGLARELIQQNRPGDAFAVANDTVAQDESRLEAVFLSGWIALRLQHDAATAEDFFRQLTESSSLITRSRGFYWLGRARATAGNMVAAQADWTRATAYPGTYYGQMAAATLAGQANALLEPEQVPALIVQNLRQADNAILPTSEEILPMGNDLLLAALRLAAMGDKDHARDFLNLFEKQVTQTPQRQALSSLALRLGVPDIAVTIARHAGRDGVFMLRSGWPLPYTPPQSNLPRDFVMGLIRQESSFNPDAVSSSNAIGLMQIKPSTAADMVRAAGVAPSAATALGLRDAQNNMQLGTAYLLHLQDRFGPIVPYMAAAYNGGPTRLARWLATAGDPAHNGREMERMIDWVENIPYAETRNYVQRVWENMIVYKALGTSE